MFSPMFTPLTTKSASGAISFSARNTASVGNPLTK
jgi:hypothetical protein